MISMLRRLSICLALLLAAHDAPAGAVLINFDAPADGAVIDTFYFNPLQTSVSFANPVGPASIYARSYAFNHSAGNVVSVIPTGIPAFNAVSGAVDANLNVVLTTNVLTVTVMVAAMASSEPLGTPIARPYMQAFDQNNALLGTVYFQGALPTNPFQVTPFERLTFSVPRCVGTPIQCTGYGIGKVRFSSQQSGNGPAIFALFDDFQWNPPVCSAPVIANGNGSACSGTINTDACAAWICSPGYVRHGSDPACNGGSWTGTYSCDLAAPALPSVGRWLLVVLVLVTGIVLLGHEQARASRTSGP